jgi:hypothetical protein
VVFLFEVVVKGSVDGDELLRRFHSPEPKHGPFSSSERLV